MMHVAVGNNGALPLTSFTPVALSPRNLWGRLIQDLRAENRISQRQLAVKAKVNRSTLRRIEDGEARGDIDIIERLLNYLGYELEAILSESVQDRLKKQAQMETDPAQRSKLAAQRLLSMGMSDLLTRKKRN